MVTIEEVFSAIDDLRQEMRDDPTVVPHLYVDKKWSIAKIAEHTGLHRSTVYRRLEASGDYKGPGKSGAPRQTHCKRNHSLAKHGVERKDGGRSCRLCKQERERKS